MNSADQHNQLTVTDRLLEKRMYAGEDPKSIVKYHRLVARYLRMKAKHENIITVYAKLQGIA